MVGHAGLFCSYIGPSLVRECFNAHAHTNINIIASITDLSLLISWRSSAIISNNRPITWIKVFSFKTELYFGKEIERKYLPRYSLKLCDMYRKNAYREGVMVIRCAVSSLES